MNFIDHPLLHFFYEFHNSTPNFTDLEKHSETIKLKELINFSTAQELHQRHRNCYFKKGLYVYICVNTALFE
jgi:hypothetical protein